MEAVSKTLNLKLNDFLIKQESYESHLCETYKKVNGIFLTNDSDIIDAVLHCIPNDTSMLTKFYLEPSCGQGAFLLQLIMKAYTINQNSLAIYSFIENNLHFADFNLEMIECTKKNISDLYFYLFKNNYTGKFNSYCVDFTIFDSDLFSIENKFLDLYEKIDFVLGNPPYITLYGRRDKKQSEEQRIYYLKNYSQFPVSLKNGKINYIMLFIERGLKFLKFGGKLSFIIDVSFFETAYEHCRKLLVENYTINALTYNLNKFDNVASGQLIIEISNMPPNFNSVLVTDAQSGKTALIKQSYWNNPHDEYKFRISHCGQSDKIIEKISLKNDPTLQELYPQKSLRTCVMLLDMEDKFTSQLKSDILKSYPYYRGSQGLKYKYSILKYDKYFHYDKSLQDNINDELKKELILQGIKNKKRIGLGETEIYDNPKVYIRQSAKELIASYDEHPSSANNSLYVFSLRDNSEKSLSFLKYLCGLINSTIYTFFAQQRRIIRYNKGKQPQIKISDLYQIFIPANEDLKEDIVSLVEKIYAKPTNSERYRKEIDTLLYQYYSLGDNEVNVIEESIESFLR